MRRPNQKSKDPEEKMLARYLSSYTFPGSPSFRPEFKKWIDENCPPTKIKNKADIIQWVIENHRRPRQQCADPEEKRLGGLWSNYSQVSGKSYDLSLVEKINKLCPKIDETAENKKKVIAWIIENKRRPKQHTEDKEEHNLG